MPAVAATTGRERHDGLECSSGCDVENGTLYLSVILCVLSSTVCEQETWNFITNRKSGKLDVIVNQRNKKSWDETVCCSNRESFDAHSRLVSSP